MGVGVGVVVRLPDALAGLLAVVLLTGLVAFAFRFRSTGVWVDDEHLVIGNVFRTHLLAWTDVVSLTAVITLYKRGGRSFAVRVRRPDGFVDVVPIPLLGFGAIHRITDVAREHGVAADAELEEWPPR